EQGLDPDLHSLQSADIEIRVSSFEELHELVEAFGHPVLNIDSLAVGCLLLATEGEGIPVTRPLAVALELLAIKAFGFRANPEEEPDLPVPARQLEVNASQKRAEGGDTGAGRHHDEIRARVFGEQEQAAGWSGDEELVAGSQVGEVIGGGAPAFVIS